MWLELTLPVLPIIASCLISISELQKTGERNRSRSKRRVTQTVVLFTVIYILLNLPFCCYFILANINRFSGFKYTFLDFDKPGHDFRSFVVMISVILNSAVNPLVYLTRFERFRGFVVKLIKNQHRSMVFGDSSSPRISSDAALSRYSFQNSVGNVVFGHSSGPRLSSDAALRYSYSFKNSVRNMVYVNRTKTDT